MESETTTGFSTLQQLQRAVIDTETESEARFVIVNETNRLVSYLQAGIWHADSAKISALSGVVTVELNAPFVRWMTGLLDRYRKPDGVVALTPATVDEEYKQGWQEWLSENLLIIPLHSKNRAAEDFLFLVRVDVFKPYELTLLQELAVFYAQGLRLNRVSPWYRSLLIPAGTRRRLLVVLVVATLLFPVRVSVLAPAEVAPKNPFYLRAPYSGVIDVIHVQPYAPVVADQLLVSLDAAEISNQKSVAQRALETAEAEYRQSAQAAVVDADSKLSVAIQQGRLQQRRAELTYVEELVERLKIRTPQSGIAVFNDVSTLIGRPVQTGEAIFLVAEPEKVKLSFRLPVSDAIELSEGSDVRLFLNISPNSPFRARLRYLSFTADEGEDGSLAYVGEAEFLDDQEVPRVGLRGTAKLYGARYPTIYWMLRKPLAFVRQFLGV